AKAGDEQTAAALLARLRGSSLTELPRSSSWLVTMYGVVETANLLGNDKAAARAYDLLRPFANLPMTASLAVACFGAVHHALGVAALTTGDLDRAVSHLQEAVHRNLGLGHFPAAVVSRLRYAQALALRGRPDDRAKAQDQRARAAEMAAALGMPAPADPTPTQPVQCTRHGRRWRIGLGTRTALVDHSVGMLHLAVLTANPGVEIPAIDLAAGVDALGRAVDRSAMSSQPVLDAVAMSEYRQRLVHRTDQIDDLAASGDRAGAVRAGAERDWILAELAANTGLAGRPRAFTGDTERARIAVGRAIRRTLAQIERVDPTIAAQLRAGIHTGARCSYRPI